MHLDLILATMKDGQTLAVVTPNETWIITVKGGKEASRKIVPRIVIDYPMPAPHVIDEVGTWDQEKLRAISSRIAKETK